jgi:hypothetical protein
MRPHVLHRPLHTFLPSWSGTTGLSSGIRCPGLYLSFRCGVPVRMGSSAMDIHCGDPYGAVTVSECRYWGMYSMALQLRHRAVFATHACNAGRKRLWYLPHLRIFVFLDVFVRLFLHPRNKRHVFGGYGRDIWAAGAIGAYAAGGRIGERAVHAKNAVRPTGGNTSCQLSSAGHEKDH